MADIHDPNVKKPEDHVNPPTGAVTPNQGPKPPEKKEMGQPQTTPLKPKDPTQVAEENRKAEEKRQEEMKKKLKEKEEKKEKEVKEVTTEMKNILDEYGGMRSSIPLSSPFWDLQNRLHMLYKE